jgi:L-fuculose-phosphate aldolase
MAAYTTPSYKELGESVIAVMNEDTNTVMLGNHGAVCFDSTMMGAYYKLEILDAYCRILLLTLSLGRVNQLTPREMYDLLEVKAKFGMPDARIKTALDGGVGRDNRGYLMAFPQKGKK